MNQFPFPHQPSFTFIWKDLEKVLTMMSVPTKQAFVTEAMEALRISSRNDTSEQTLFSLVCVIAWLTDHDGTGSDGDWIAKLLRNALD